ncbi:MAG: DUF3349 domain-containing protein [Myxococcales bacterium]
MNTDLEAVPGHLRITMTLLRAAYPSGIPEADYLPLLAVMSDSGVSDRNIAAAIGLYLGQSVLRYLYDVRHVMPTSQITYDARERVISC